MQTSCFTVLGTDKCDQEFRSAMLPIFWFVHGHFRLLPQSPDLHWAAVWARVVNARIYNAPASPLTTVFCFRLPTTTLTAE